MLEMNLDAYRSRLKELMIGTFDAIDVEQQTTQLGYLQSDLEQTEHDLLLLLVKKNSRDIVEVVRELGVLFRDHGPHQASIGPVVDVYLETDDERAQDEALRAVDSLLEDIGLERAEPDVFQAGSIFRRTWTRVKEGLTSSEVKDRLQKVEAYAESYLDERRAGVVLTEADAFAKLVKALEDVPQACIRLRNILLIKYRHGGETVILHRSLSVAEEKALDAYPEIQRNPGRALELLETFVVRDGQAPALSPDIKA